MLYLKLKSYLDEKNFTQAELIRQTGIRKATISAICNNTIKELPVGVLEKICDTLECQPGDIIENLPPEDMDKKREVMSSDYVIPRLTKEERAANVKLAIAIATLDAPQPSEYSQNLLKQYVDGNISEKEMLQKTIDKYKEA
jgi:putative transcriptional regulator